jgi:hypothetical protein
MEDKKIKVRIKRSYGVDYVYPACPISVLFAKIADSLTLTKKVQGLIKELGYTIEVLPEELK